MGRDRNAVRVMRSRGLPYMAAVHLLDEACKEQPDLTRQGVADLLITTNGKSASG